MSGYYETLLSHQDPGRASGWRGVLDQALRFEVALEAGDFRGHGLRVLDLGCGTGELCRYLRHSGRSAAYTGVDVVRSVVERARATHADGRFVHADVLTLQLRERFEVVVAIGTLVSGDRLDDRAVRLRRLAGLAHAAWRHCDGYVCLVVLKEEVVRARPLFNAEPVLAGATREELERIGRALAPHVAVRDTVLETDRALLMSRRPLPRITEPWGAHERVLSGRVGRFTSELDHAWLWLEAGQLDRAAAILERNELPPSVEAKHLRERLTLAQQGA